VFVHQEQVDRDVRRITFTVLVQCILQSLARLSRKHSIHFAQITSNLVVVVYHSFQAPRASTVAFVALLGLLARVAVERHQVHRTQGISHDTWRGQLVYPRLDLSSSAGPLESTEVRD
jgi:hypothetical protein